MKFHLQALYRNLVAARGLALFMPVRAFDYRAAPVDYALLLAFNVSSGSPPRRSAPARPASSTAPRSPSTSARCPSCSATALIVSIIYGERERLLLIATALTASDPVFELVALRPAAARRDRRYPRVALLAILAWLWAVSVRAVIVCAGTQRPQVFKGALAVTAMTAIGFFAFPRTDVWNEAPEARAPDPLTEERIFHLQGQLIERALAAIAPGRPGVRDLYFVGFAPDASQDVFVAELRFVRRLFDERFGTAGRSIALASSQDALEEFPIASVTTSRARSRAWASA